MNIKRLMATLVKHEGYRARPYKCTSNKWTVGVGRNLEVGLTLYELVTLFDQAEVPEGYFEILLKNDIERVMRELTELLGVDEFNAMSDIRQEALINVVFNMGAGELLYVNPLRTPPVPSKYARQVGKRAQEVAKMLREG